MLVVENSKLLINPDGSPLERISGFETEYALDCETSGKLTGYQVTRRIAAGALPFFQFHDDGSRRYLDDTHPEFSTPEEISYRRSAHRLLLGHITMANLYRNYSELKKNDFKLTATTLFANTIDILGNSWSSHENILAARGLEPEDYINALATHNLSRIVWSGAGHVLGNRHRTDFRFCLSERAETISELAHSGTTMNRPLVNLKDEALADRTRFRRIHGIAGETVFSPTVNALRQATTSIILRACELGVSFDDLLPDNPPAAMRAISHDPTLRVAVDTIGGQRLTGIELQLRLAERAITAAQHAGYLTVQEAWHGEQWVQLCEDLRTDPASCERRVDWIVKQKFIERALSAKQATGTPHSPFEVAFFTSLKYHRLLPTEGYGMQLIRKGFFDDSPSADVLENGLPLAPTRAALRGEGIRRLQAVNASLSGNWWRIDVGDDYHKQTVTLGDPHQTHNEELETLLDSVAA